MKRLGRAACRIAGALGAFVVLLAATAVVTSRPADPTLWPPKPGEATVRLLLVNNGFHSGIVVPRVALLQAATATGSDAAHDIAARFEGYTDLEFGWGEEEFYRNTPTTSDIDWRLAVRALFWPSATTVIHVAAIQGSPDAFFDGEDRLPVEIGAQGLIRLVRKLDASVRRERDAPIKDLGVGLYGPSLFYPATGRFGPFADCNGWVADLVASAGLPATPVVSLWAPGLFAILRYRMSIAKR